jgi:serine/tyrosine/threonine adenylyltransferase
MRAVQTVDLSMPPGSAPVAPTRHGASAGAGPVWSPSGLARSLGPAFAAPQPAQPVPRPHWVARNHGLATELGWTDWLKDEASGGSGAAALALLSGAEPPPGGSLATVYSGHQFGVWAGQLGDGRALLLGEAATPMGPVELQLKGSGLTPFSRMGDGRAVLRSSIREYLASEALHALGVPTTRALALVGSPLPVRREAIETAAVVTRVAPSFVRFGHFEHFTHTAPDQTLLRALADALIDRHFPEIDSGLRGTPAGYAAWLSAVAVRTAELVAHWQAIGFCHGVMNTDNMSILGLTIDYGPYGFLDAYDPAHICNHSDHQGRYAYHRQPGIAFWNLHALAHGLLPLLGDGDDADAAAGDAAAQERALAALEPYKTAYAAAAQRHMRAKLGLHTSQPDDAALADALLALMARDRVDFTIAFRRLADFASAEGADTAVVRDLFIDRPAIDAWASRYAARLRQEGSDDTERAARMRRVNPKYVLRNHLAQQAIDRAQQGDFGEIERLHRVLQRPFDEQPEHAADAGFPPDWAGRLAVSCSS